MEINKNKLDTHRGSEPGGSWLAWDPGAAQFALSLAGLGFPGCGISLANFLPQSMLQTLPPPPSEKAPFEQHNKI